MVKVLDRETVNRMVSRRGSTSSRGVSGGSGGGINMNDVWGAMAGNTNEQINISHMTDALADYATESWVGLNYLALTGGVINGDLNVTGDLRMNSNLVATQQWVGNNYLSISFFSRLFKAYNGSTQVNPNDTTSTITNIKAMFGFWTEFYITALGTGGQSTLGIRLSQLADVNVAGVSNGQVLMYDGINNKWVPGNVSGGGGTGVVAWADITGKPSTYPPSTHNHDDRYYISSGTIYLGTGNITPITSLSGYALESWVSQNFLGSNALTGYALSSWVENNFYSGNGGRIWGNIHLQSANTTYGNYIVFGDRGANEDYVYIQENSSDHLLIYGYSGVTVLGGGHNGVAGRVLIESYSSFENYGLEIACSRDSQMRIASDGEDYGLVEIMACHNVSLYTRNETATVQLHDWSTSGGSWAHNAGAVTITTKNGNITLNPSNGNTEVYNFVNRSDIRNKDVIRNMEYDLDIFAKAPLFSFTWKIGEDRRVRIGTSAQYWMDKIPETVTDITSYDKHGRLLDEHLSLDYISVTYAGMVTNSRRVSNHEERIKHIEKI